MLAVRNIICCCVLSLSSFIEGATPPIEIEHRGYVNDKPHVSFHSFRLKFSNQHDKPVWFILPRRADIPLSESDLFGILNDKEPFSGVRWKGEGGSVILVHAGQCDLLRIPASGRLEIPDYELGAQWDAKEFGKLVVFEAAGLKVNEKTPLEDWLPFHTMSDKQVKLIEQRTEFYDLDWKTDDGHKRGFPTEKVQSIVAQGLRHWTIQFKPAGEFDSGKPYPLRSH